MHLNTLRTFLAIVETGSLVGAARKLNITQSAVTSRLQSLENDLGQPLIHRAKSGASVTAAGQRLQRHAQTMLNLWHQTRQETALPGAFDGVCNIACHPDLWPALTETLFDNIRADQPNLALSIWQGAQHDMTHWLTSGTADICISYWATPLPNHTIKTIGQDNLILVSTNPNAPTHFDPDYVFVENGEEFGHAHAATYADANTARLSFGSATLGLGHMLRHGGTAYIPERCAEPHLKQGKLHLINAQTFTRDIYLITHSNANWPWLDHAINKLSSSSSG